MTSQNRGTRSLFAQLAGALASAFLQDRAVADRLPSSTSPLAYEEVASVAQAKAHTPRRAKIIPFPAPAQRAATSARRTPLPFLLPSKAPPLTRFPAW